MSPFLKEVVERVADHLLAGDEQRTFEIAALSAQGYDIEGLLELAQQYSLLPPQEWTFVFREEGFNFHATSIQRLVVKRLRPRPGEAMERRFAYGSRATRPQMR